MKSLKDQAILKQDCPEAFAERLKLIGGTNHFGEANFRLVWGWNRIVPISGEWQEFEQCVATMTDKKTGYREARTFTRLKGSVIETRLEPKYLPANCWHLESWRPPEEYGSPEQWAKQGAEIIGVMTVDTAGPYPSRGEYELCYPLTDDGSSHGNPLPLVEGVIEEIVRMIEFGRNHFSYAQRKAAIEQELHRKEQGFVRLAMDQMKDKLRPFAGEAFTTVH